MNYPSAILKFKQIKDDVAVTMARANLNINGLQLFLGENSTTGKFVATQEYVT